MKVRGPGVGCLTYVLSGWRFEFEFSVIFMPYIFFVTELKFRFNSLLFKTHINTDAVNQTRNNRDLLELHVLSSRI